MAEKPQELIPAQPEGANAPERALESATGVLAMIERAASNPAVDVDKMKALLDLQERILNKQAEADYHAAMSAAQGEMRRVSADAENDQTHSKYASYAQLDRALRPIYVRHGFSISYGTEESPLPDCRRITADVSHRGGWTKHYIIDMPADGLGPKGNAVMTKTHAVGAASTYGMRYLLKLIFNVAIGEDDTDGNAPPETINEQQIADLESLIEEVNADRPRFLKWAKVTLLAQITTKNYQACVDRLREKGRRQQTGET